MKLNNWLGFLLCGLGCLLLIAGCPSQPVIHTGPLQWTKSTPLPEPREGYAAGVLDGKLIIAGGTYWLGEKGNWTKKLFSASTHAFDPATQKWQQLPDMPFTLGYSASTVVNNRLYVIGGYTGTEESPKVLILAKQGNEYIWKEAGKLPDTRLFAKAASIGSSIYLLGGVRQFEPTDDTGTCCTSKTATNQLMVFDTTKPDANWRQLAPYPAAAKWLFAAVADEKNIWMFGGIYSENPGDPMTRFRDVLRYNIGEGTWTTLPPLPPQVLETAPLSPLLLDDKILLMSYAKTAWQLDPQTMAYSKQSALPEEVIVDRFVWIDDLIIGAGGESKIENPHRRSPWTFVGRFGGD